MDTIIDAMSTIDDISSTTASSDNTVNYVLDPDQEAIIWDGVNAHILGTLHAVGEHLETHGLYQDLIQHGSVSLSNGKLAVPSELVLPFVTGKIDDPHDFANPCPSTAKARIAAFDARSAKSPTPTTYIDEVKAINLKDSDVKDIISSAAATHAVARHDGNYLDFLSRVFGHAEPSNDLIKEAKGSGMKFVEILRREAANATPEDKALAHDEYIATITGGVNGDLNLASFKQFMKRYRRSLMNIPELERPMADPAAEVMMINRIVYKYADLREYYRMRAEANPPKKLADAEKIVLSLLRTNERYEALENGGTTGGMALAAQKQRAQQPKQQTQPPTPPPPPSLEDTIAQTVAAVLAAINTDGARGAARGDPNKNKGAPGGKKGGKIKASDIERDEKGRAKKWIEGFHPPCDCGIGDGKHLYRDCPKKAAHAKSVAEKAAAGAAAAALAAKGTGGGAVAIKGLEGLDRAALLAKLNDGLSELLGDIKGGTGLVVQGQPDAAGCGPCDAVDV